MYLFISLTFKIKLNKGVRMACSCYVSFLQIPVNIFLCLEALLSRNITNFLSGGKNSTLLCKVSNMTQACCCLDKQCVLLSPPSIIYSVQPGAYIDKCFQHQVFTQWNVMDVKSLKMPGALTARAVARLSRLRRKYTIQNRINGSEGCVCVFVCKSVCVFMCECVALSRWVCFVFQITACKLTISHSRHNNSFGTIHAVEM